jgi:hypothetical protein
MDVISIYVRFDRDSQCPYCGDDYGAGGFCVKCHGCILCCWSSVHCGTCDLPEILCGCSSCDEDEIAKEVLATYHGNRQEDDRISLPRRSHRRRESDDVRPFGSRRRRLA